MNVGTHGGTAMASVFLGGVAAGVIAGAACWVVTVRK